VGANFVSPRLQFLLKTKLQRSSKILAVVASQNNVQTCEQWTHISYHVNLIAV